MKNRKKKLGTVMVMLMFSLCGCSLAVPEGGTEGNGRLIGAFITPDYLDLYDMEGYLEAHASDLADGREVMLADDAKYEEKLYADIQKNGSEDPGDWKVSFGDIAGVNFFTPFWKGEDGDGYWASEYGDGICDTDTHIKTTDTGEERSIKGTVYILPGKANENIAYYVNPVYQTQEGRIFVVSGQGFSTSGDSSEGVCMTTELADQVTTTENGKSVEEKSSVAVSIAVMYRPVKITIFQMDRENRIIRKAEYSPAEVPQKLTAESGAEYILVETEKENLSGEEVVSREIYERSKEEYLETFYAMENGMVARQSTEVVWQDEESVE
ncbi:hypothetical protein ABXS75_07770 [Roseburia hominis]